MLFGLRGLEVYLHVFIPEPRSTSPTPIKVTHFQSSRVPVITGRGCREDAPDESVTWETRAGRDGETPLVGAEAQFMGRHSGRDAVTY